MTKRTLRDTPARVGALRRCAVILGLLALPCTGMATVVGDHQDGAKYSPLDQINRDNVNDLEVAWEFHTGDDPHKVDGLAALEDQPTLIEGNLIVCSISRKVFALDPATGAKRWEFDPQTPPTGLRKCRGVANWVNEQAPENAACRTRLIFGTADYKLFAIDARTGKACADFGDNGVVEMPTSKPVLWPGEVVASSNPVVVNGVVVVGSAVADNQRVDSPSGRVLAYDALTGEYLWEFDPVPRDPNDPAMASWGKGTDGFGQGNVWSSMAADADLDLVYLPTTSASNDFYGGERPGDNHYTTSVVALRGATGEVVWHQQVVHHNVWDYDIPTRPMLIDYPVNGKPVPALLQNTKMGLVFIYDRATGEPLVPIEERPVPQSPLPPGEVLSPTQPFPVGMPPLVKLEITEDDELGMNFIDSYFCRKIIEEEGYLYGPIYTPMSEQGTLQMPAAGGGPNWGGASHDPNRHIIYVPTNRVPMLVKLVPRDKANAEETQKVEGRAKMAFANPGSRYALEVAPLMSPLGTPCAPLPWAGLTALDIVNKKILWDVPLGSIKKLAPIPLDIHLGTPGAGGLLLTAGGLVFIGYTLDDTLRAFDADTGEIVWESDLPAAGTGVPITYEWEGEQYLVMPAGGHSMYGSTLGDSYVAYKLKK
ncbi:pyrroloquinoline quinone-dependent dehydrogenase [Mangrovimicrobium sediminis]|nr:pyrroloquinoline quinone-dependent dehydrogenase [Haliea sp. SAOS-164]